MSRGATRQTDLLETSGRKEDESLLNISRMFWFDRTKGQTLETPVYYLFTCMSVLGFIFMTDIKGEKGDLQLCGRGMSCKNACVSQYFPIIQLCYVKKQTKLASFVSLR